MRPLSFVSGGAQARTALWVVLFGVILACLWHHIATSGPEIGDFAANSILVQVAKQFRLLTGNYSRAGFNHPGPALLYVLAAGESLFYDHLHWVPSALGAQLVTVAALAATWMSVSIVLIQRLGFSRLESWVFIGAFAAFAASVEPEVFGGLWFPHLYFLPFAVFTLAVTLLLRGAREALVPLAVSCGFLFNGHVSFVPICGVMILLGICTHVVLGRLAPAETEACWLSGPVLRRAAPHLLIAAGVLLLFAVPLLIRTVAEFPDPIAQYLSFGRQNGHHGGGEAASYLSQFWGRQEWQKAVSLASLAALAVGARRTRFGLILLAGVSVATIATLVYAVFGIDDYQWSYIAIFYGAVPAIVVGGALATLVSVIARWRGSSWLAVASIIACGSAWASIIARPAWYSGQYNVPEVVSISQAIDSLSSTPVVLDFSIEKNWPQIQVMMLGVDAYRQRLRGTLGYCIGANWDLSLSRLVRCSDQEVVDEQHLLVDTVDTPVAAFVKPEATAGGLSFFRFTPPCLRSGETLAIPTSRPTFAYAVLGEGWSSPEGDFVWSQGRSAYLNLCRAPGVTAWRLDLGAYLPGVASVQTARLSIDGQEVARVRIDGTDPGGWFTLSLPDGAGKDVVVKFDIDHPVSPQEATGSTDTRPLGFMLRGIAAE